MNEVVLGVDIGARSIGWALVQGADTDSPELLDAGVRLFEAGVKEKYAGDISAGKEVSGAVDRRIARSVRRQNRRRAVRKKQLFRLLQEVSLLPATSDLSSVTRDRVLGELDKRVLTGLPKTYEGSDTAKKMPYVLRAEALQRCLTRDELARVLLHFASRRGFKSNRKIPLDNEESGVVYKGISETEEKRAGRTLGQYFASINPEETRIRQTYTARHDYEDELNAVFDFQSKHHPQLLTTTLRNRIYRCLFDQRPLKSSRHLIGKCSLAPSKRRCLTALPVAQRFRVLQTVNALAVIDNDGRRFLSEDERRKVLDALMSTARLTFTEAKRLLGLSQRAKFNFQTEGKKDLKGNQTGAAMMAAIGGEWDKLSPGEQEELVVLTLGSDDTKALQATLRTRFPHLVSMLSDLDEAPLERTRSHHCRDVIIDLNERMRDGVPYATAKADYEATHGIRQQCEPVERLPKVTSVLSINNPAVIRSLTELRKVVNELIQMGKPDLIRIELARDIKKSRKARKEMAARQGDREKERRAAEQKVRACGVSTPTRRDIEKWLLAEECNWTCPFTGMDFADRPNLLFGRAPKIDVEHIIPQSLGGDSTFTNLTLCEARENRHAKGGKTPHQAYGGDPQRFRKILSRVAKFKGPLADEKRRRFETKEVASDFAIRDLTDTAYASREAINYLGFLYGGSVDANGVRRVQATNGRLTGLLRRSLGFIKDRNDHRHHAIDAVVIAMTSPRRIKDAANFGEGIVGLERWRSVYAGLGDFADSCKEAIKEVVCSRRPSRTLSGAMHAETLYSKPRDFGDGYKSTIRKPVRELSLTEIKKDLIVDETVRELVRAAYDAGKAESNKTAPEPREVFCDENRLPRLPNKNGPPVVIRRVTVVARNETYAVGRAGCQRFVQTGKGGLHHTTIFVEDSGGCQRFFDYPTSLLEACRRKSKGEPVFRVSKGSANAVLHLCSGDIVEMDADDGDRKYYLVRSLGKTDIRVSEVNDGSGAYERLRSADKLVARNPRKVDVSPAGVVRPVD